MSAPTRRAFLAGGGLVIAFAFAPAALGEALQENSGGFSLGGEVSEQGLADGGAGVVEQRQHCFAGAEAEGCVFHGQIPTLPPRAGNGESRSLLTGCAPLPRRVGTSLVVRCFSPQVGDWREGRAPRFCRASDAG